MNAFEEVGKGVVKRTQRRVVGLFIDGTGLDRATRRINRKVDMSALIRGVTAGSAPVVARYYTMIPNEDDSRQRAFLDAVSRAGLEVIVKRLPPKGVNRQVSVDVEMGSDISAFALGHYRFSSLGSLKELEFQIQEQHEEASRPRRRGISPGPVPFAHRRAPVEESAAEPIIAPSTPLPAGKPPAEGETKETSRIVTVVCPSRDLAYTIALAGELGADTVTADFGQFGRGDVLKSAAKWIDLSDSETIWRD